MTDNESSTAPLASTIEVACRRLSIGKTLMYAQIKAGAIRTVKIGNRTLITERELQRFLAQVEGTLDAIGPAQ